MKIETAYLTGPTLDWAVAKCEGKNGVLHDDGITRCIVIAAPSGVYKGRYTPTVNWAQGGPLIEGEGIHLYVDESKLEWVSSCWGHQSAYHGPTPLVAAMRCFVASKLGDEVEIPEELL